MNDIFQLNWIVNCVKKEYYYSKHGDQERQNDNLLISEIEEALINGKIIERLKTQAEAKVVWWQDLQMKASQYILFAAKEESNLSLSRFIYLSRRSLKQLMIEVNYESMQFLRTQDIKKEKCSIFI